MLVDVCDYVTECNEWAEVSRGLFLGHLGHNLDVRLIVAIEVVKHTLTL